MPHRRLSKKRRYGSKKYKTKKRKSRDKNDKTIPSFLSYLLLVSMLSSGNYLLKESRPKLDLDKKSDTVEKSLRPVNVPDKFEICNITGDGSCMFRSIQHQLNIKKGIDNDEGYKKLRPMVKKYIMKELSKLHDNNKKMEKIMEYNDIVKGQDFKNILDYMMRMSKEDSKEWGDNLSLVALSDQLRKRIVVVQTTDGAIITIGGEKVKNMDEITDEDIVLSYYPENHYNSLVKKY